MNKKGIILLELIISIWLIFFVFSQVYSLFSYYQKTRYKTLNYYSDIYNGYSLLLKRIYLNNNSSCLIEENYFPELLVVTDIKTGLWVLKNK